MSHNAESFNWVSGNSIFTIRAVEENQKDCPPLDPLKAWSALLYSATCL